MPELPEVEVVRRGLADHVVGRRITAARVLSARTSRRFEPGGGALARMLAGRSVARVGRRGKFLWFELVGYPHAGPSGPSQDGDGGRHALVVHLGMSGQMRVRGWGRDDSRGRLCPAFTQVHPHLRAYFDVCDRGGADSVGSADSEGRTASVGRAQAAGGSGGGAGGAGELGAVTRIEFVDQRTFGWWLPAPLVDVDGTYVPVPVAHIARDPMDPRFDAGDVARAMRAKHTEVKRLLLDQTIVSGIGNIYADEALWRAGVHGARAADALTRPALARIVEAARTVMAEALDQGGTSFDSLYVNVNGESGYFARSLGVYGRAGKPCSRCGAPIRREEFMNRSSYSCPRCQVRPRYPLR